MKNIKIFAFLAVFLLSAAVSTAWAKDVTLTYKIDVQGTLKPVAHIYNAATGEEVASWDHGIKTLWPAGDGHTMNDDYKITFKPNQELDKIGKNENDGTPSTTAFRTEKNTIFTVSVGKGFYFKSVTFKEDGTEKASSSNIAPNSTSISVEVPENKFFNYITVVLTNDFHYGLSYDGNLTVSPSPSMTYNNIPYYAAGQTVTFGFSGSGSVVYFVNGERIEGNSVTVRKNLDVQIGVPYIDENGKEQIRKPGEYTVLTSDVDDYIENGVINLNGGWYVVQGKVKYSNQVKFSGDAHLILADGAEMEIVTEGESEHGIYASKNLTIYGQNGQSGILNDTAKGPVGHGIYSYSGDITIIGGKVTATSKSCGIYGKNGVTISGGTVEATGTDGYGIYGKNITISGGTVEATGKNGEGISGKDITISGGTVTATGTNGDGIYSYNGNITLGWTNSTDFIKASSYYSEKGSVQIAEGKSFKDEDGKVYSGTLSSTQLDIIKKKTLKPCYAVTLNLQDGNDPVVVAATFDENGVAHVAKPADPIRSGFTFEGWFTAKDGNTEFDFTKAVTGNTTAYAHWNENTPVEYIDEKGETKKTKNYILLTNDINVDNLPGSWYVVQGGVKYTSQVKFSGDAHLILADGAKLEIVTEGESEHGIYASNNLTIYGQNGQSGILNDTAKGTKGIGIYSNGIVSIIGGSVTASGSSCGIYGNNGVTISGGSVTASGYNGIYSKGTVTISVGTVTATGDNNGIYGSKEVTISGGNVTATSTNGDGIYSYKGVTISVGTVTATGLKRGIYGNNGVTISGGKVTATSTNGNGIYSVLGDITLGWTNSTDFIKASSYSSYYGAVKIVEGKSFKDEDGNVYRGTLTGEQLSAVKGKTLEPCYAVTFDAQNGDDPIMLLTTFDENGAAHVKKPNDPIRSGFTFEGWFTATDGNTEFDFSAAITGNTTAYAHWTENTPVEYIDENGKTKTVTDYTVLTSSTNVSNLPGGWYVVQGEVKYTSQVKFSGDAHLILADGAEMEIKTEGNYGIYASKNLTIYGQNEQSGILNDTANGTNGIGIFSWSDITISGGKVTATGKNGYGIYGYYGVTISDGSVEATSTYGIYSKETVTISGGSVTASGNNSGINTNAGHITLGWTNSTDFIKVSSIHLGADSCTVSIAEGKSFVDENGNEYRGTLTDENLESIKNKTLTPLMPFPDNIVIANISGATYTGDSIRPEPVVTIGENVLELGKDYTLAYKDNLNASDTAKVIVKGAGKYYGEVQKLFTIDKAPLKITALNDTIVYGDEPANQGVAYEGFVGNETSEVLKGELALKIGYKQYGDAGKYAITPSGLTADNYEIEFVAGTLTVEPKVISIVWGEQTVFAYDGKEHVPTVTAEGFVEGHVVSLVVTGAAVEVGNDTAKVALDENDANSKNYKLPATGLEKEFKIVMPIAYIDENGVERTVTDYTVLTSDVTDYIENGVINLDGGWYVVQGKVKYSNQVNFGGDAHLILADGAKLEIETKGESEHGIYASNNLTIYGQNGQSGILNDTANGSNGFGIYSKGTVTIIGGTVTATGGAYGIYCSNGVTINGGSVTAAGKYYGIHIWNGSITIIGGKVEATGSSRGIYGYNGVTISGGTVKATGTNGSGIYVYKGNITLGWTNSTDNIKASSYYSEKGSVQIAEGNSFKDEKGRVYSGTLSDNQIAAISHQTIEPLPWKNLGDYAAVQIFEDENGKKHAVIDGEYEGTETVDIPNEIAVDAVDYIRDFDANTPSTVLMPVRLPSCATVNAKFYKLDYVYQSGYRWVAKVQNIGKALPQANTAYAVMMPTAGKLEFNFEGCATAEEKQAIVQTGEIQTSGNTDGSWYFTGTYAFKRWIETENKDEVGLVYGFAGSNEKGIAKGQFGRVDFGAHANPLRCYLRKKDDSVVLKAQTLAKAAPQMLRAASYSVSLLPETIDVEFVDEDEKGEHTTAIGRMDTRTGKIRLLRTDRTYDLKGRRVNDVKRAAKGAYYGKKF